MARDVKIAFLGDVSGLKKALADGEAAMKRNASAMQRTADTFDKAGNMLMGAGVAMAAGLGFMAKAADDAQQSQLKLDNTLANAPSLVNANKQALLDLASAMQTKTKYDDEAFQVAESVLGQFGATQAQIETLIPLVADYASKTGTDLTTASQAVGKALQGKAKALIANGIEIDKNVYATDRYTAVVNGLNSSVKGFAEQEGKTFSGQLEILKNQLMDVVEGVGPGIIDVVTKMGAPVKALGDAFSKIPAPVQALVGSFAAVGAGSMIVIGGVLKITGAVMRMGEQVSQVSGKFGQWMSADYSGKLEGQFKGATKSMISLNGAITAGIGLATAAAAAWALWSQRQAELTKEGKDVQTLLTEQAQKGALTWDKVTNGLKAATGSARDLHAEVVRLDEKATVMDLDDMLGAKENASKAMFLQIQFQMLAAATDTLAEKFHISKDAALSMAQRNLYAGRAADDTRGLIETENEELQKQADAFDKALQAAKGYFDFARGQVDALGQARQANRDFAKSLQENGSALDLNSDKGYANVRSLESAISAWQEWGLQQIKAGADIGETTGKVNEQISSLQGQAATVGINQQQFDFWRASLAATPTDISTAFSTPGLAEANAAIRELLGNLAALGRGESIMRQQAAYFQSIGMTSLASQYSHAADLAAQAGAHTRANIPGRAVGGGATAGGMYLVGERGPELLQMGNRSGRVIPNGQAAAASSSIVVNVGGSVVSERDLVESIGEALRRREVARL